jgi:hypothetical protein
MFYEMMCVPGPDKKIEKRKKKQKVKYKIS